MKSKTFKDRLLEERQILNEKVIRLHQWIASENFNIMTFEEQRDQNEQVATMQTYLEILDRRINRLGLLN